MKTKICTRCGDEKSVTEYHKNKLGKYGVQSVCKACRHEKNMDWRERTSIDYTNKDPLYEQVIAALPRDGYPRLEEIEGIVL